MEYSSVTGRHYHTGRIVITGIVAALAVVWGMASPALAQTTGTVTGPNLGQGLAGC